jgi:hypothetical protein
MPHRVAVWQWCKKDAAFREQFEEAQKMQAAAMVDEALRIADDGSKDIGADGKPDWSAPQRDKLRAELRLKIAARLDSKWAETKVQTIQGNADKPIEIKEQPPTDAERAAAVMELLKTAGLGAKVINGNAYEQRHLLPSARG